MPAFTKNKLLLDDCEDFYFIRWNGCTRGDTISAIPKMCYASVWVKEHEDLPTGSKEQEYDEAAEELEEVEESTGEQLIFFSNIGIFLSKENPHAPMALEFSSANPFGAVG
jgi:hypothetical protein